MSLDQSLQQLTEEEASLSNPMLLDLSGLSPGEVGRLARVWPKIDPERRHKVVAVWSKWSKTIPSWTSAPYSSSVSKTLMRPSDNRRYLDFGSSRIDH